MKIDTNLNQKIANEAAIKAGNATRAASAPASAAALQAQYASLDPTIVNDLNTNNFAGAFQTAAQANKLQPGDVNGVLAGNGAINTTNPLMLDLETAQGLHTLDPSKQWTPQEMQQYYTAAMAPSNWNAGTTLGKDPYGTTQWGSNAAGKAASDAATNASTAGDNSAPDIARFAGKQPDASFAQKWGLPIAMVAAAVLAPEAIGVIAPALEGAGLGATAATVGAGALYGAGTGAIEGAIGGGNVGKDALLGGLGGGISGALGATGATSGAENALTGAGAPQAVANGLTQGAEGAGIGALTGAIRNGSAGAKNGALLGGVTSGIAGGIGGEIQSQTGNAPTGLTQAAIGAGSGIIANDLVRKYLQPVSAPSPGAPAQPISMPVPVSPATTAAVPAAASAPAMSTTQQIPQPTPAPATPAQNIGSYSGFNSSGLGFQPRTQVNPGITNYNTYGQGPEASFYAPTPGT